MMDSERFIAVMAALSWSQNGLADRLGLPSHTTVRQWAAGRTRIPESVGAWLERVAAGVEAEPLPPGWIRRV